MRSALPLLALSLLGLAFGCSGSDDDDGGGGSNNQTDEGVCSDVCPRPCDVDQDCDTAAGNLCCDFGAGKACTPAAACPRFCAADTQCATEDGEACVRPTLVSSQMICLEPEAAVRFCSQDSACDTEDGEVCCTIYDEPVCLPANRCPRACNDSSNCDTGNGQVCCTALSQLDPTLRVLGLCVDPDVVPCPTTCQQSSDCDTADGELCCNGVCSTSCPRTCQASSDCRNQICCKVAAARDPIFLGAAPPAGYLNCNCQVGESRCDGASLRTCDGCSESRTDCNQECISGGADSGTCVEGPARCQCDGGGGGTQEQEPNDSAGQANDLGLIPAGFAVTVGAELGVEDLDTFRFSVSGGFRIVAIFTLAVPMNPNSCEVPTFVELLNEEVISIDSDVGGGFDGCSRIDGGLTEGSYFVVVGGFATGRYLLTVSVGGGE